MERRPAGHLTPRATSFAQERSSEARYFTFLLATGSLPYLSSVSDTASALQKINLAEKFSLFSEHWRPKVVARLNGQEIKLIKVRGEFPWHHHEQEDEFFLIWKGTFIVEFRDRSVTLAAGEGLVVPRGVEHRTRADDETEILCFEPAGVRNTGNVTDEIFTAPTGAEI